MERVCIAQKQDEMSTRHGWHWLRLKMRGRICITGDVPVHINYNTLNLSPSPNRV